MSFKVDTVVTVNTIATPMKTELVLTLLAVAIACCYAKPSGGPYGDSTPENQSLKIPCKLLIGASLSEPHLASWLREFV